MQTTHGLPVAEDYALDFVEQRLLVLIILAFRKVKSSMMTRQNLQKTMNKWMIEQARVLMLCNIFKTRWLARNLESIIL